MGHLMGMYHDHNGPFHQGEGCTGYMDYTDYTNHWSKCSVEDLTRVDKGCLAPIGPDYAGTL